MIGSTFSHFRVTEALARISHRRVKRSAGGAGDGGVFDPTGAESYSAVRRAPGGEKTPPTPDHRALQPRGGEKCRLARISHRLPAATVERPASATFLEVAPLATCLEDVDGRGSGP